MELLFWAAHTPAESFQAERPRLENNTFRFRFTENPLEFIDMLNAMRFGKLTPETIQAFARLNRRVKYDDGIEPTDLSAAFVSPNFRRLISHEIHSQILYARRSGQRERVEATSTQDRDTCLRSP